MRISPKAVFLVVCDPSMNEIWVTKTGVCLDLYGSRLLTAHSWKGCTWLKIQPQPWLDSLKAFKIDNKEWEDVNEFFLKSFDRKHTAKTVRANFQDFIQKPVEKVYDYFVCNINKFCWFMRSKQKNDIPEAYTKHNDLKGPLRLGRKLLGQCFQMQLCIPGLWEALPHKVMKLGHTKVDGQLPWRTGTGTYS